jgi:hypothetical protein
MSRSQSETYVTNFYRRERAHFVERGLPHPNTLTIKLPSVFIGLRTTGLPCTVKEFVISAMSAQLDEGVHDVSREEISLRILQAGGSVSRSGLRLALAELVDGTPKVRPRLRHVRTGLCAMPGDGI